MILDSLKQLPMDDEQTRELFMASMYMKTISELIPTIQTAIAQVASAHVGVQEAMHDLRRVQDSVSRLSVIAAADSDNPAQALKEMMTVDDMIRQYEAESFVYFIEAGDYIKIGYSRDPMARLIQIRKGRGVIVPDGLSTKNARFLAVEQGGVYDESTLHKRFSEHRVAGEWFEKNDRLTHYIRSITTPTQKSEPPAGQTAEGQ